MEFDKASAQFIYEVKDLSGTEKMAEFLALRAIPGTVIALDGDLGAGKTAFSKLFAKHFDVKDTVNSPTFTLIKEYEGRLPFYHMDVYRLSPDEAEELGLDEYFYGTGVTLVEWASVIMEMLPRDMLHIYMETVTETERKMYIRSYGEPYEHWVSVMRENGVS